ncbi:MAG: TetR/AcrR family transcriptional regulator [Solirubrobacterales bacterium]|nr:TetR/AcrR family transcriptional regulator [Solirubrobacterales bacterium]
MSADHFTLDSQGSHRQRLLAAMADAIREDGLQATTVAGVVRRARTSRRTFYQHFDDLDGCYLALFDAFNEHLLNAILEAATGEGPWPDRIDRTLGAYLGTLAAEPELTRSYVQDAGSLGEAGALHVRRIIEQFARELSRLVEEASGHDPSLRPLPYDAAIVLVGGLRYLVIVAIADGRDLAELAGICGDLVRRLTLA